jgi:hypothetical protein
MAHGGELLDDKAPVDRAMPGTVDENKRLSLSTTSRTFTAQANR